MHFIYKGFFPCIGQTQKINVQVVENPYNPHDKIPPIKSNKQKYCSKCAREIETENSKIRFRKWYYRQKSNDLENPQNPHK